MSFHPSQMGLNPGLTPNGAGFSGFDFPIPTFVDFMWTWNRADQRVTPGELIWYRTTDNIWRFAKTTGAGYPLVPANYFSSCDGIVIRRAPRMGNDNLPWTIGLPYSKPTKTMTP
jgi:hypothetical protein